MKEERTKKKSEPGSDILAWVGRSRKIEENKYAAKERAKHLSKIFEEQVSFFTVFPVFWLPMYYDLFHVVLVVDTML